MEKYCIHCESLNILCLKTGAIFAFQGHLKTGDAFFCDQCGQISIYGIPRLDVAKYGQAPVTFWLQDEGKEGRIAPFPNSAGFGRVEGVLVDELSEEFAHHCRTWYPGWWKDFGKLYKTR